MTARDHISVAKDYVFTYQTLPHKTPDSELLTAAGVHALLAIACTLADMADMDADTRTQPTVKPPAPPPHYELSDSWYASHDHGTGIGPHQHHTGNQGYGSHDGIPLIPYTPNDSRIPT